MESDFENLQDLDNLSDSELRRVVRERLEEHGGIDPADITVSVRNGEVRLSGRVGTEMEARVAERVVTDQLGIVEVHNELLVDPIRRAASPSAIDDHLADEEEHEGLLLGDRAIGVSPEAEHLDENILAEVEGTTDVQQSIERAIGWVPPESPTPEGSDGTSAQGTGSEDR